LPIYGNNKSALTLEKNIKDQPLKIRQKWGKIFQQLNTDLKEIENACKLKIIKNPEKIINMIHGHYKKTVEDMDFSQEIKSCCLNIVITRVRMLKRVVLLKNKKKKVN
jgi:hypothetical protein